MEVIINGQPFQLEPGSTVMEAVRRVNPAPGPTGIAVAVNGQVVPRSQWEGTELKPGDKVEVVQAVQGG